jgi:hypothetical protein
VSAPENKSDSVITKRCRDCGQTFELTRKESDWYFERNLQQPKRCAECRAFKRKLTGGSSERRNPGTAPVREVAEKPVMMAGTRASELLQLLGEKK